MRDDQRANGQPPRKTASLPKHVKNRARGTYCSTIFAHQRGMGRVRSRPGTLYVCVRLPPPLPPQSHAHFLDDLDERCRFLGLEREEPGPQYPEAGAEGYSVPAEVS